MKKVLPLLFVLFIVNSSHANLTEGFKAFIDTNYEMAIHYFEKTLEESETDDEKRRAKIFLGISYRYAPDEIDTNYKKSFALLKDAGEYQYNQIIHSTLGHSYRFGLGTEQDIPEAIKQYELANKYSESVESLYQLGFIYRNGIGIDRDYSKALEYYQRASDLQEDSSQFELGLMHEFGMGVEKNIDKALEYYRLSAEKMDIDAKYRIHLIQGKVPQDETNKLFQEGLEYMYGIKDNLDWDKAIEIFKRGADNQHPLSTYNLAVLTQLNSNIKKQNEIFKLTEKAANLGVIRAQSDLASYYENGTGIEKDSKKSAEWEARAAAQGNIESIRATATKYKDGSGVDKNFKKAIEWYEKGAELNDPTSLFELAQMVENGKGIEPNIERAIELYIKAAKLSNKDAYKELIDIYLKGHRGVPQDTEKSFKLSKEGAEKGFADSQNKLASHYYKGVYVDKDMEKAFEWYKKAADQGLAKAYFNLGVFYDSGIAVKKDYKEAFKWFLKGAENGHKESQYKVGEYYDFGFHVQENNDTALDWFTKAANQGYYDAQYGLGKLYYYGNEGYDVNYQKAADWFRKAADNKDSKEDKKKELAVTSYGSGFFVTNNHIVTNNHVTEGCDEIEVKNKKYSSKVELVDSDSNTDLSILSTGKPYNNFLSFRNGKPIKTGETAIVLGYPLGSRLGSDLKVTVGNIAALTGYKNNITELQLTAPVQPGNSGGPLLDDNGNVVGIIVASLESTSGLKKGKIAQNVNFAIKSNMAKIFMDLNSIEYDVRKPLETYPVNEIVDNSRDAVVQIICKEN